MSTESLQSSNQKSIISSVIPKIYHIEFDMKLYIEAICIRICQVVYDKTGPERTKTDAERTKTDPERTSIMIRQGCLLIQATFGWQSMFKIRSHCMR